MVNQPDQDMEGLNGPSGKLVLPAPPNEGQYLQPYTIPIRPEQLIRRSAPTAPGTSHSLFSRLTTLWRKDPAYRVLSLAIALVVISSIAFVTLGAKTLMSNGGPAWSQAYTQHPATPAPFGTVDNKPTFPSPSTGPGSNQSSQPPAVPTPSFQPTPTPVPTTDPNPPGNLDVQITNIPSVVSNNTKVHVDVQATEPNATVMLEVTYSNAFPTTYTSPSHTTDGGGNATLTWSIRVFTFGGNSNIEATVVAVATDQNGQQASSQPVIVQVQ
jgi:hypothetical protein